MLKTDGVAKRFQHSPWDLANVNEWKIMFDPYINMICINTLLLSTLKFEIDLLLIKLQDNSYTSLQLQLHV